MIHDLDLLAALPCVIPERGLVTFPCLAGGRLVHCAICGGALALLWCKPGRTEALVRRRLAEGRGKEGGLCITAEDAATQVARELVEV